MFEIGRGTNECATDYSMNKRTRSQRELAYHLLFGFECARFCRIRVVFTTTPLNYWRCSFCIFAAQYFSFFVSTLMIITCISTWCRQKFMIEYAFVVQVFDDFESILGGEFSFRVCGAPVSLLQVVEVNLHVAYSPRCWRWRRGASEALQWTHHKQPGTVLWLLRRRGLIFVCIGSWWIRGRSVFLS